jgi:hypothetical protein
VVPHRGRRRDAERRVPRQQVDGLVVHLAVVRDVLQRQAIFEEAPERRRIDDGAGEEMRARLLALLDDGHRHVAEALGRLGRLLEQLPEADGAGEAPRPRAHDQDADLDALVRGIGRRHDHLRRVERRRVIRGSDAACHQDDLRARTSSVNFGTI